MSSSFRRYMCAGLVLLAVSSAALAAKEDKKKKDAPPEPPKAAVAEPGLVAIVGDMKVTDQDLVSSLPPNSQKGLQAAEQNIKTIERTAMQEQFAKRYIADQAAKTGMSEDDFVAKEIAANRDSFSPEYRAQISQAKQQIYDGKRQAALVRLAVRGVHHHHRAGDGDGEQPRLGRTVIQVAGAVVHADDHRAERGQGQGRLRRCLRQDRGRGQG